MLMRTRIPAQLSFDISNNAIASAARWAVGFEWSVAASGIFR